MIFGRMANFGRDFILIGLNAENVANIQKGNPITIGPVQNDPVLGNAQIIVVCGETQEEVMATLDTVKLLKPEGGQG